MKPLLVHEWIEPSGGAEKVLDVFAGLFPTADLACLWNDAPQRYPGRTVHESWLSQTRLRHHKAATVPLMSPIWRRFDTKRYDWALVSSHSIAHHFGNRRGHRSIPTYIYAHTPARYLWAPDHDPRGARRMSRLLAPTFKRIDRRHAGGEGANYAVNSKYVQKRAEAAWGVDVQVIYPPVDVRHLRNVADWAGKLDEPDRQTFDALPDEFVLGASRFVPYKQLDTVMRYGASLGLPVVIAGGGPEESELRAFASQLPVPVHFVIQPSSTLLYALMQRCLAYVFPAVEDFGLMPVEAMALGSPLVVNNTGGAAESAALLRGGALTKFEPGTERESFETARALATADIRSRTSLFDVARFENEITLWLREVL